ncbi:hypothetical protein MWU78_00045 [Arenibacter sp. F26102]|uniref:hypothetical protein n=1 Tax=Arenibacter sp. F26102 TaxID=2926416 RepID=UPI001FF116C8|nr:hypothetical protein [Arenibacter sp. F26102]MCK0144035.1 hypothetical protein [Arenibacter sp. F26102]
MDSPIDVIENRISLLDSIIVFEDIIDEYLSETYTDEEIQEMDILSFRKRQLDSLQYRFAELYNLNVLSPQNGFSILQVKDNVDLNIKKYIHRFLSYKSVTGGSNANADGSAELFEDISANAVKNFLGDGSKVIMVGEGRSNLTIERLNEISNLIVEKPGVYHNLPGRAKDDGVDFIVYKPLDIRNTGNLIILGQACVGKHFEEKKVIHQRWQDEYITFAIKPPTTLLSVVYFLESDKLRSVHSEFGNSIVFDRGRILKFYDISDDLLNTRIIDFVIANIND